MNYLDVVFDFAKHFCRNLGCGECPQRTNNFEKSIITHPSIIIISMHKLGLTRNVYMEHSVNTVLLVYMAFWSLF